MCTIILQCKNVVELFKSSPRNVVKQITLINIYDPNINIMMFNIFFEFKTKTSQLLNIKYGLKKIINVI